MNAEPVIVRSRGTFRNEVSAGPHTWILDEPTTAGGGGEGPTPYDMLAAALGGCTSMTLQFYARRENIALEAVEVTVTHDRQHAADCADCVSTKSGYIHRFRVAIRLDGYLTETDREKLMAVAEKCPVSKTLGSEIKIDVVGVTSKP